MKAGYYLATILASLLGWGIGCIFSFVSLCYLTPVGILIAGLWAKDPKWWIHFIIASFIAILPPILLILGIGGLAGGLALGNLESVLAFSSGMSIGMPIAVIITHILNFGGLIYSVVYIIIAGRRLPPSSSGGSTPTPPSGGYPRQAPPSGYPPHAFPPGHRPPPPPPGYPPQVPPPPPPPPPRS